MLFLLIDEFGILSWNQSKILISYCMMCKSKLESKSNDQDMFSFYFILQLFENNEWIDVWYFKIKFLRHKLSIPFQANFVISFAKSFSDSFCVYTNAKKCFKAIGLGLLVQIQFTSLRSSSVNVFIDNEVKTGENICFLFISCFHWSIHENGVSWKRKSKNKTGNKTWNSGKGGININNKFILIRWFANVTSTAIGIFLFHYEIYKN